jgi:hypothetical protein
LKYCKQNLHTHLYDYLVLRHGRPASPKSKLAFVAFYMLCDTNFRLHHLGLVEVLRFPIGVLHLFRNDKVQLKEKDVSLLGFANNLRQEKEGNWKRPSAYKSLFQRADAHKEEKVSASAVPAWNR